MRYIVEKESLLGYVTGEPNAANLVRMVVMAVDVPKGGDPILINREYLAADYREATKEDFEHFCVVPPTDL